MKQAADWAGIERRYRAGLLSMREIAKQQGISEGAVRKKAKALGWERDLIAKAQQVRTELVRSEVCTETARTERQQVAAATKALEGKRLSFVLEYCKDQNATQAAIRAGYSVKTAQEQGSRLLSNVMVRAEVDRHLEEYRRTAGIEIVDLLLQAKHIALSDIAGAFDPVTGALLPVHRMSEGVRAALSSIKVQELAGGVEVGGEVGAKHVPMFTKEVKLWDKPGAIFRLLEYFKGVPPAPQTTTNIQINVDKALMELRAAIAGREDDRDAE